jgi:hypothetical protein
VDRSNRAGHGSLADFSSPVDRSNPAGQEVRLAKEWVAISRAREWRPPPRAASR